MKASEIQVGNVYAGTVSSKPVPLRVLVRRPSGDLLCRNLDTLRDVIRTPGDLRWRVVKCLLCNRFSRLLALIEDRRVVCSVCQADV